MSDSAYGTNRCWRGTLGGTTEYGRCYCPARRNIWGISRAPEGGARGTAKTPVLVERDPSSGNRVRGAVREGHCGGRGRDVKRVEAALVCVHTCKAECVGRPRVTLKSSTAGTAAGRTTQAPQTRTAILRPFFTWSYEIAATGVCCLLDARSLSTWSYRVLCSPIPCTNITIARIESVSFGRKDWKKSSAPAPCARLGIFFDSWVTSPRSAAGGAPTAP